VVTMDRNTSQKTRHAQKIPFGFREHSSRGTRKYQAARDRATKKPISPRHGGHPAL
jgi:hypothetical protein